jgi:copper chaperone CopZ
MEWRLGKTLLMVALWVVTSAPAFAQVERVIAQAVAGDIDCLPCAVTIEAALRKLPYVEKVSVSMSQQRVAIIYKPEGGSFRPQELRDGIGKAEVRVAEFHIAARGVAKEEAGKVFFVAGRDRFLVPNSQLPLDVPIGVMALVDDSTSPFQIKVNDFQRLDKP